MLDGAGLDHSVVYAAAVEDHSRRSRPAGGSSVIVMQGPDGTEVPNRGVYLEVVPSQRLVFTDAFSEAWTPSTQPFMTAILTFDDAGEGWTRYVARVRHWTLEAKAQHEAMGFHDGWGVATRQLETLARTL